MLHRLVLPLFFIAAACGDDAAPAAPDAASPDAPDSPDAPASPDAGDPARDAAARAALEDPRCVAVAPFTWEIGDASGVLASGAHGTEYGRDSVMPIASATKWLFGAYVVERFRDDPSAIDRAALTMQSGYVSLSHARCIAEPTVASCFTAGDNETLTPDAVGHFSYGGGHYQRYAVDLGLGADTSDDLAAHMNATLGLASIAFASPQPAGGARMSAAGYASFLQAILRGDLAIRDHLGAAAVCTLPGASCPTALYSPVRSPWHYSYGHWIEDGPGGDGAFSSAGAFGFYPWIDAGTRYYGIVARHDPGAGEGADSALCGAAIRAAFLAARP